MTDLRHELSKNIQRDLETIIRAGSLYPHPLSAARLRLLDTMPQPPSPFPLLHKMLKDTRHEQG